MMVRDNICFQPLVVVDGSRPTPWVPGQPSLLKGSGLTWNEMLLHLPSSTHSGDKHSSIPERPCLRQGTDRAVHLANKASGARLQGSQMEVGRGRSEGVRGCKVRLCESRRWVEFPLLTTSLFHLDTFPLALKSPHKV